MSTHQPTTNPRGFGVSESWIGAGLLSGDELRRARTWLQIAGILALISGVVAVAVPVVASVTMAIFVGWTLVFAGIVMASHAFASGAPLRVTLRLLEALLTLLVGIYVVVSPLTGTVTLTFMLAVWFFGTGLLTLLAASRLRGAPGAGVTAFSGTVSIVLGLLIALDLPSSAAWAIGLLVGINLIFLGVRSIIAAQMLRHLADPRAA
jgi:uncharacterized membrane protein HdeD (DUF308 family)